MQATLKRQKIQDDVTSDKKKLFLITIYINSEILANSFLNFRSEDNDDALLLGEEAEFKIILETKNEKTNIFVESLSGSKDEAEALKTQLEEAGAEVELK